MSEAVGLFGKLYRNVGPAQHPAFPRAAFPRRHEWGFELELGLFLTATKNLRVGSGKWICADSACSVEGNDRKAEMWKF